MVSVTGLLCCDMPFINAGPMVEEIFLPESIMTASSITETSTQRARKSSFSYYKVDNLGGEIHIRKKRQSAVSWVPDELDTWEARRSQTSQSIPLEKSRGRLFPTTEEDAGSSDPQSPRSKSISFRLHWSKSIQQPEPEDNYKCPTDSNGLSREKFYQSPLPLRQPSGTARNLRNSSLRSLYNMADLVKIKYQRKYWIQLLIEYGTYTALAAFVYFVLVGVPLWKGAVCWLYWAMQHKLIFSCGWTIAIALILLYVSACVSFH
jgi:hypothetical protein